MATPSRRSAASTARGTGAVGGVLWSSRAGAGPVPSGRRVFTRRFSLRLAGSPRHRMSSGQLTQLHHHGGGCAANPAALHCAPTPNLHGADRHISPNRRHPSCIGVGCLRSVTARACPLSDPVGALGGHVLQAVLAFLVVAAGRGPGGRSGIGGRCVQPEPGREQPGPALRGPTEVTQRPGPQMRTPGRRPAGNPGCRPGQGASRRGLPQPVLLVRAQIAKDVKSLKRKYWSRR